jgi:hypothetical protein
MGDVLPDDYHKIQARLQGAGWINSASTVESPKAKIADIELSPHGSACLERLRDVLKELEKDEPLTPGELGILAMIVLKFRPDQYSGPEIPKAVSPKPRFPT